ncbi:MAG: membrane protein insertase YidC [Chitinophagaceae bacterium]|jgi:YidC/Oxa1 family membrane protein insertase|nr:membrane protein insertase YidC [Chitinophagaceae bacterium]
MNFDRNTIIGFVVLGLLFFGYFYFTTQDQKAYQMEKAKADSIANLNKPKADTAALEVLQQKNDSVINITTAGSFNQAVNSSQEFVSVENELMKVVFTTKGGQPEYIELKKFKDQQGKLVRLASSDFDKIDYAINTGINNSAQIAGLNFLAGDVQTTPDGNTQINFTLQSTDSAGPVIVHHYVIKPNDYMIDFNIQLSGASTLLTNGALNFNWNARAIQLERDIDYEKQNSQVGFSEAGDFDYYGINNRSSQNFETDLKWVAVKQQFFNTAFIAKNGFESGKMDWVVPSDSGLIVEARASLQYKVDGGSVTNVVPLQLYYGPNDYKILKGYNYELENLVNLGQGMFAFVKYINRWIVLPVFDLIKGFVSSYGIVILLLTILIRLVISPLTYKSYLSGAKMKVLRPEIAKLKEKYGNDQQQISMEQMKLFREAGVNPLGGCIPALLQIPIFFALYSFFSSHVALRGESFLWAKDLSTYDTIYDLGFNIPLYGDHISLFTITATITSLIISLYSMSMTPDQNNPVLKYMPYFFPVILLFVFNSLPSALTWYYTVSNLITLVLQFIIQNYIIDNKKILAKIEINRKKPKTKSKWQERMEQAQDQQKKLKEMQKRK